MSNNRSKSTPSVALLALLLIVAGGWGTSSSSDDTSSDDSNTDDGENQQGQTGTCFDGMDNDGDGSIDSEDPDCEETAPWYDGNENGEY